MSNLQGPRKDRQTDHPRGARNGRGREGKGFSIAWHEMPAGCHADSGIRQGLVESALLEGRVPPINQQWRQKRTKESEKARLRGEADSITLWGTASDERLSMTDRNKGEHRP